MKFKYRPDGLKAETLHNLLHPLQCTSRAWIDRNRSLVAAGFCSGPVRDSVSNELSGRAAGRMQGQALIVARSDKYNEQNRSGLNRHGVHTRTYSTHQMHWHHAV